jgi:scyllo-inositol 2-dehydrogenase (NAD+)
MVKALVIGCGRMGAGARCAPSFPNGWLPISHAGALKQLGIPVSFCDTNADALLAAVEKHGGDGFYDYRKAIDALDAGDIVTIATRTPVKSEIIDYCTDKNLRIYVEKPIANSVPTLKTPVKYGVNRRYHLAYRRAMEMIEDGALGKIHEIVFEFGLSPLLWCHPHTVDLMLFFLNRNVETVEAKLIGPLWPVVECDPLVEFARFTWEDRSALITQGEGCNTRIYGDKGTLTIHGDGHCIQLATGKPYRVDFNYIHTEECESATVTAMRELLNDVYTDTQDIETGMRMLMACVHSAKQGRCVSMHESLDHIKVLGMTDGNPA